MAAVLANEADVQRRSVLHTVPGPGDAQTVTVASEPAVLQIESLRPDALIAPRSQWTLIIPGEMVPFVRTDHARKVALSELRRVFAGLREEFPDRVDPVANELMNRWVLRPIESAIAALERVPVAEEPDLMDALHLRGAVDALRGATEIAAGFNDWVGLLPWAVLGLQVLGIIHVG